MAISVVTEPDKKAASEPLPRVLRLPEPMPPAMAINRTRLQVLHMADYTYPNSARQVVTFLRLRPPEQRGWQTCRSHTIHVAPLHHTATEQTDTLGNRVVEYHHERVQSHLTFAVEMRVVTHCAFAEDGSPLPTPIEPDSFERLPQYREFTRRTTADAGLQSAIQSFQADYEEHTGQALRRPTLEYFAALCRYVHTRMTFDSKATGVQTTAADAWQQQRGVCQDYSHIALTLCRLAGIPARYVSGFVPGEGVMHAWVEALLPVTVQKRRREFWFAYDPTYNKWVDDNYVTVATGRDYGDITPTSGTYYGGPSVLKYRNTVTIEDKQIHLL